MDAASALFDLAVGGGLPYDLPFDRARPTLERAIATARDCMDEEAFAIVWAEGRAMTPEQVIAEALGDGQDSPRV